MFLIGTLLLETPVANAWLILCQYIQVRACVFDWNFYYMFVKYNNTTRHTASLILESSNHTSLFFIISEPRLFFNCFQIGANLDLIKFYTKSHKNRPKFKGSHKINIYVLYCVYAFMVIDADIPYD